MVHYLSSLRFVHGDELPLGWIWSLYLFLVGFMSGSWVQDDPSQDPLGQTHDIWVSQAHWVTPQP